MISVTEAFELIKKHRIDYGTEPVAIEAANGRVLAQDIVADRDFPPFDRVTMDGIAISTNAFMGGQRVFKIEDIQAAGQTQKQLMDAKACIEIMTGAVLPAGCDAVIPYEDCVIEAGIATVQTEQVVLHQHIHPKASDEKAGQLLVAAGTKITPAIIGTAATVGLSQIMVQSLPRVAICSTGDELVAIEAQPAAHQIRRSNSYMLAAALQELKISSKQFHLPDDRDELIMQLTTMLKNYDVLLFSGAVSKGKFDFLPEVLDTLGMQTIFHRVAQKPGKPLLFGKFMYGQTIFGFPGNPVSTLVCFKVFFSAWLNASLQYTPPQQSAILASDFTFKPNLSYHLPVIVELIEGRLMATPNAGNNSGDMVGLAKANAVITLPNSRHDFKAGEVFPVTWLKHNF